MEESAVSEAVGVILMVALTVILAAIIGAYAFGLVGDIPSNYNVVLTIDKTDSTHFNITYRGGADHLKLESLRITWPSGTDPALPHDISGTEVVVGKVYGPAEITFNGKNQVIVVGHFSDEKEQVLLNAFI
jgi:hypothetical protein